MTTYADPTLDLQPLTTPEYDAELSLAERFAIFHQKNPHVADALEFLARQWLAAGNHKIGMKALFERLRWESGIQTSADVYRLNNSYVAFYARLLIERHPIWREYIDTRASLADGA